MNKNKYGVHASHCCSECGCKYGADDCPVYEGVIVQKYPCEDCENRKADFIELVKTTKNLNEFFYKTPLISKIKLQELLDKHRSKAFISCDETCFCWDVEEWLE